MAPYNVSNWYWIVGDNASQAWSSAAAAYISSDDATYKYWLSLGYLPTKIESEASLQQVLAQQYPAGWPGGDLSGILAAGINIISTATPTLNGTYAIDDISRMDIIAIETSLNAGKGFPPGGLSTLNFPDASGSPHTFSEANFTNFAAAVRDYYYACVMASRMAAATKTLPSYPNSSVTIS